MKKTHENDIRYPVRVDVATDKAYGEHAKDFTGYVVLQDRSKVGSLLDNWHDVDDDLKDRFWTDITVFILNFINYFTSMYDHLIICLILITIVLGKHKRCLMLVQMIVR